MVLVPLDAQPPISVWGLVDTNAGRNHVMANAQRSIFADRFYWARTRKGLGATLISRLTGCAQSLVSYIERNNRDEAGEYGKIFAEVFEVNPEWLLDGKEALAPPGWDARAAREGREKSNPEIVMEAARRQGVELKEFASPKARRLVQKGDTPPEPFASPVTPAWSAPVADIAPLAGADKLMPVIVQNVLDFQRLAGSERTKALIEILSALVSASDTTARERQSTDGKDDIRKAAG